jgi:hypothetical protein
MSTDFITQLSNTLKEKKGLAESTADSYLRTLLILNNKTPFKTLSFLRNKADIDDKISKYAESTQKSILAAIVSVLSLFSDKATYKGVYKHYFERMMAKAKDVKEAETGDKTEKQKQNWVEWKDVMEKSVDQRKKLVELAAKKTLTGSEAEHLLQSMVLSLYVCIPPRRNQDYLNMMVVKKWTNDLPANMNYLDISTEQFIFNKYKTAKKYGIQTVPVPQELMDVLVAYLRHHAMYKQTKGKVPVPFLVSPKGEPLTAVNSITRILNKIFGKKVGSSMLRHIFLSDKYGEVKDEMANDAKAMGHSVDEQQNTYVVK